MHKIVPNFIPDTIASAGINFQWEGIGKHIGPVETRTKLMDGFAGITSCGSFCLAAGLLTWTSFRFAELLDVSTTSHLSDAAFAFMADPLSLDLKDVMKGRIADESPVVAAYKELRNYGGGCIYQGRWYRNASAPRRDLFHFACLLRHVLDSDSAAQFDDWIEQTCIRLRFLAPKPPLDTSLLPENPTPEQVHAFVAPHWGMPIPFAALSTDLGAEKLQETMMLEAAAIDWPKNPYVQKSPNFAHPYGLGPI